MIRINSEISSMGGDLKTPISGDTMFIFTRHYPMLDKLLNTGYE
jgi:hypothetical protein